MRTRSIVIAMMALALPAFVGSAFAQGYDYPSMVGYWSLDEGAGSVAGDPFGRNGTLTFDAGSPHGTNGAGPTWVPGRFGQALSFDGIDDYVEIEPDGGFSTQRGSVSLWIQTTADQAALGHDSLIFYATRDGGDGYGGDWEFGIYMTDAGGNLNQAQLNAEGADYTEPDADVNLYSGTALNNGQWHHIVATWQKGGNAVMYVDGAQTGSTAWVANNWVNTGRGDSGLRFGKPWSNGNGGRYYQGLLDDVRLYSRVLTLAEVQALHTAATVADPIANVRRTLPPARLYKASVPFSVTLEATAIAGGEVVITETVPGGLTPTIVGTPAGSTGIVGSVLTWTVTPGATPETLEYTVTPTAGTSGVLDWVGSVNAGTGWTYNVQGGLRMVGNVPIGIFDWHGDIGAEPIATPDGDPALAGDAVFGVAPAPSATGYWIEGGGSDVWQDGDYCHLLAKLVDGAFILDAYVAWVNPLSQPHTQTKVGVMVRGRADRWGPYKTTMIDDPSDGNGGDVMSEGRTGELEGMFSSTVDSGNAAAPLWLRIVRVGTSVSSYYQDPTSQWVLHSSTNLPALAENEVAACLFVTAHLRDDLTSAVLDGISLTVLSVKSATRRFGQATYQLGDMIPVTIDVGHSQNVPSLVVEETLPAGWVAQNISDGGTQTGNVITWSLNFTGDVQLTYDVSPAGGMARSGVFSGVVRDPLTDVPIGGENEIHMGGTRIPIIMITDVSDNALEDQNMKAAIGSAGITVDLPTPQTINGLGYAIREIDENAGEETADFTTADGLLILIAHTVDSGNVAYHMDDPIPIINSEQALNDDDDPPRNETYMSEGAAARADVTDVTIINNTHPITEVFALGDLTLWENRGNAPELGVMTGAIGSGVTVLAHRAGFPAEPSLALYPAGTTDAQLQIPAAAVPYTAPAARMNLGYHAQAFQYPTRDGVILFQRCIQYMIGAPLTAGSGVPNAPSNLDGLQVKTWASLTWQDNSDNENGFVISRKDGDIASTNPFVDVGQVGANETSFVDQLTVPGNTYTYRVRAFNPDGESAPSNEFEIEIVLALGARAWHLYR